MYQLDRIEVNMLVDIHEVLQAIDEMFEEYELISKYALLFEDDETLAEHIQQAKSKITQIVNRARASDYQGGL